MAGTVEVRFSVKDEETVRVALERLGKDGQAALQKLDAASRQPSAGLKSLSGIMEELKGRATGFAFSLGPVGTGLVALGPVGLVVAASLGVITTAFTKATEAAALYAEKSRATKEASETAAVTITQFKLLESLGAQVGMDAAQTSKFFDRLTISIEELRRGTGPLFDALLRIDAGLIREVASAKSMAEAIDIVTRAWQRLDDQGQKNKLAVAIGGRGAAGAGQVFDALAEKGGLAALESNKAVEDSIKNAARLKVEIDEIKRKTDDIWGRAFAEDVLAQQKRSAEFWLSIAEAVERIAKAKSNAPAGGVIGPDDWMLPPGMQQPAEASAAATASAAAAAQAAGTMQAPTGAKTVATSQSRPAPVSAAVQLSLMQKWTSVLGEAITPAEQMRLKTLELNAAQEAGGVSDAARARALGAYALMLDRAAVAARTQIGLGTEQELLTQRLKDLDELQAKGFIRNAEERAAAERLVRKEVKETADALAVRNSATPALTKLSIDAGDLRKNLDEGLAGALRGVTSDMIEMAKGTKSLGDGISAMTMRMVDAIAQAVLMKTAIQPIANALSGSLGSMFGDGGWAAGTTVTPSAFGNVFSRGSVVPFRLGGVLTRPTIFPMANGGIGLAREAGEDEAIMPLRRMGNGRLGVDSSGMGGGQVLVQIINNHPTAQVTTREESDGYGGRKTVAVIEEMVATAFARQQSPAFKSMQSAGTLVRR
jgi:hypothetical protein